MIRIKSKFFEKKGGMYILTAVILLVSLTLMAGVFEYFRLQIIAKGVRDAVQSAVISTSTENYDNVYSTSREGYSGGYKRKEGSWKEEVDKGDIYEKLDALLGLKEEGEYHVKKIKSNIYEYRLSNLDVNIINSPLAPSYKDEQFKAETFITVEVPLSFGWEHLPPLLIRPKVVSKYMMKF
jgi:hypothetical protein